MAFILLNQIPMILSLITIQPLPGKNQEALDILHSLQQLLKLKHGCANSQIFQSRDQQDSILYMEQWTSRVAFHRHIQSDLYLRVLTFMELSESAPTVMFLECKEAQGMELIAALRQGQEAPDLL